MFYAFSEKEMEQHEERLNGGASGWGENGKV